jgi:hypothetical protein
MMATSTAPPLASTASHDAVSIDLRPPLLALDADSPFQQVVRQQDFGPERHRRLRSRAGEERSRRSGQPFLIHDTLRWLPPWTLCPCWETGGTLHLDRGYDTGVTRTLVAERGVYAAIARRSVLIPIAAGQRWVIERTIAWTHAHKTLDWCNQRWAPVVAFRMTSAMVSSSVGRLLRDAWTRYHWDGRPPRRP